MFIERLEVTIFAFERHLKVFLRCILKIIFFKRKKERKKTCNPPNISLGVDFEQNYLIMIIIFLTIIYITTYNIYTYSVHVCEWLNAI